MISFAAVPAEHFGATRAVLLVDESLPACAAVASILVREWRSAAGRQVQSLEIKGAEMPTRLPEAAASTANSSAS